MRPNDINRLVHDVLPGDVDRYHNEGSLKRARDAFSVLLPGPYYPRGCRTFDFAAAHAGKHPESPVGQMNSYLEDYFFIQKSSTFLFKQKILLLLLKFFALFVCIEYTSKVWQPNFGIPCINVVDIRISLESEVTLY